MQHNVHEMKIWHKAIDLVVDVYKLTSELPDREKFCLTQQVRKAAVSIPSNIAEGAGRITDKDFCHFLGISNGSAYEVMTQLIVAKKLNYATDEQILPILHKLDEVQKMTFAFQNRLNKKAA